MFAIRDFLATVHIGAASGWDIFILLIFLMGVFVYGFFLGKNRMIVLLLSSYFSLSIIKVIPWKNLANFGWLGIDQTPASSPQILIFLGLILLFYFLIPRSVLSSTLRIRKRGDASWVQLFILSVVQIGLLAMAILSFINPQDVKELSPMVQKALVGPEAQFIWTLLPILTIVLMKRRVNIDK